MMNDKLVTFLIHGEFLGITVQKDKTYVIDALGKPDDILNNHEFELYKYKGIEITFKEGMVVIINMEFMDGELELPEFLQIGSVSNGLGIQNIIKELDKNEVGWHICKEKSYDQTLGLVTESNVLIYYDLSNGEINKIQLSELDQKYYLYI